MRTDERLWRHRQRLLGSAERLLGKRFLALVRECGEMFRAQQRAKSRVLLELLEDDEELLRLYAAHLTERPWPRG